MNSNENGQPSPIQPSDEQPDDQQTAFPRLPDLPTPSLPNPQRNPNPSPDIPFPQIDDSDLPPFLYPRFRDQPDSSPSLPSSATPLPDVRQAPWNLTQTEYQPAQEQGLTEEEIQKIARLADMFRDDQPRIRNLQGKLVDFVPRDMIQGIRALPQDLASRFEAQMIQGNSWDPEWYVRRLNDYIQTLPVDPSHQRSIDQIMANSPYLMKEFMLIGTPDAKLTDGVSMVAVSEEYYAAIHILQHRFPELQFVKANELFDSLLQQLGSTRLPPDRSSYPAYNPPGPTPIFPDPLSNPRPWYLEEDNTDARSTFTGLPHLGDPVTDFELESHNSLSEADIQTITRNAETFITSQPDMVLRDETGALRSFPFEPHDIQEAIGDLPEQIVQSLKTLDATTIPDNFTVEQQLRTLNDMLSSQITEEKLQALEDAYQKTDHDTLGFFILAAPNQKLTDGINCIIVNEHFYGSLAVLEQAFPHVHFIRGKDIADHLQEIVPAVSSTDNAVLPSIDNNTPPSPEPALSVTTPGEEKDLSKMTAEELIAYLDKPLVPPPIPPQPAVRPYVEPPPPNYMRASAGKPNRQERARHQFNADLIDQLEARALEQGKANAADLMEHLSGMVEEIYSRLNHGELDTIQSALQEITRSQRQLAQRLEAIEKKGYDNQIKTVSDQLRQTDQSIKQLAKKGDTNVSQLQQQLNELQKAVQQLTTNTNRAATIAPRPSPSSTPSPAQSSTPPTTEKKGLFNFGKNKGKNNSGSS